VNGVVICARTRCTYFAINLSGKKKEV